METVKTGWLEKKSVMRWQKRWFALYRKRDSSRAWFAYFDGEPRPGDVLDERAAPKRRRARGAPRSTCSRRRSRFQVILAKHALKCGAADDAARDAWMRALRSRRATRRAAKVCDFGLSRCLSHEGAALTDGYIEAPAVDGGANNFTEYVVTRWYRAEARRGT
ncbi:MAP kinase [Aureococcus anophagefferens]|nr:MAP kinase [Aureococcus anophagefferens]